MKRYTVQEIYNMLTARLLVMHGDVPVGRIPVTDILDALVEMIEDEENEAK